MRHRIHFILFFIAALLVVSNPGHAQDMDIEQADSLNFQSFHKDKKEAVKAWEKPAEIIKTYDDKAAAPKSGQTSDASTSSTGASNTSNTISTTANSNDLKGKRFELRERYTLTRSGQTPYSAFYVIEPLYKQAAQLCSKGWKRLSERSEPIEQDFYLYFEIECL